MGDVAAVEVGLDGGEDDGAGDGELLADVAAGAGAFGGVALGGVDASKADALAADGFETEVDEEAAWASLCGPPGPLSRLAPARLRISPCRGRLAFP